VESKHAKPLVLLNPPPAELGGSNAIVWGRAKQYYVAEFPGPLSIKTVVRGSAMWETREAERLVDSGSYLVLNAGRVYSLTVDARETVERAGAEHLRRRPQQLGPRHSRLRSGRIGTFRVGHVSRRVRRRDGRA